jgi:hypothetical protein
MTAPSLHVMNVTVSPLRRLWIALRFVIFAVGGLGLLFYSGVHLAVRGSEDVVKPLLHPLIATGLLAMASLSILYGLGRWGRWLYLPAMMACPFIFLSLLFGFAKLTPHADKNVGVLFCVFAVVISLSGLRWVDGYYRRREVDGRRN